MAKATEADGGNDKVPTSANDIQAAVENANAADDTASDDDDADDDDSDDTDDDDAGSDDGSDADDKDDKSDDADDSDDDDSDDDADDKPTDDKSKRKFSQFKGDGSDKAYISNLEKGYTNSSAEAIKLRDERDKAQSTSDAILRAANSDPELAGKLKAILDKGVGSDDAGNGDDGSGSGSDKNRTDLENPFLKDARTRWNEKSEQEIEALIDANPELVTDEKTNNDVKRWMKIFSDEHYQSTGKLMTGGEAMRQAMQHLGIEDKSTKDDDKQDLASGAKKTLTGTRKRSGGKKPNGNKPQFSESQIAMAKSMGRDEAWLQKNAT